MEDAMTDERSPLPLLRLVAGFVGAGCCLAGCNSDSFFNPSVSGYWEPQPTGMPILERLDVIEPDDNLWGTTTDVTPEDLVPNDLSYRAIPGDVVTVAIYELFQPGVWSTTTRRIDPTGFLRLPELGDVPAGGKTPQEIQETVEEIMREGFMDRPVVDVVLEEGSAFNYTVYGSVPAPGLFTLRIPDLRLLDAMAVAGGVSPAIKSIYVIREIELSEDVKPAFERGPSAVPPQPEQPVDIDELIERMEQPDAGGAGEGGGGGGASPGAFGAQDQVPQEPPVIDIEDLAPVRVGEDPPIDIDRLRGTAREPGTWIYVEERGDWVRLPLGERVDQPLAPSEVGETMYAERVIRIPVDRLLHGDSRYNIVVRPGDRVYVEPPPTGFVYVDGQIARPGSYGIPPQGLTLSRLVAAAGGLGALAIPERVDLIRKVGPSREAAITLNLGAIRHRTEPDVALKTDDHVIIGTNWLATPLAIIRSGFRATYGFGFLLDRNFGNDVFGPPPEDRN
jgi:polysaccharide export outer membrane protein